MTEPNDLPYEKMSLVGLAARMHTKVKVVYKKLCVVPDYELAKDLMKLEKMIEAMQTKLHKF